MKTCFAFLILLSLFACKRDEKSVNRPCTGECIIVNIQVGTDHNAVTPVGNAKVELGWNRPATPIGDPGRLIATGTTNNNGKISFSFKAQEKELNNGQYYINIDNGPGYFKHHSGFYDVRKADSILNVRAYLPSKATLKLILKNFTPKIQSDFFSCSPYYKTYRSLMGLGMHKADGNGSNTHFLSTDGGFSTLELYGETAGNDYTYFQIIKKKNGNRIDVLDSIYIPRSTTKTYTIDYNQ